MNKSLRYALVGAAVAAACPAAPALTFPDGLGINSGMEITIPSGGRSIYGNGAGFNVGVTYDVPLARRLSFQPGAQFFYNTMSLKEERLIDGHYYQGAAKNMGIRIPLMLQYTLPVMPNMDVMFATGPWLNFNVSARQNTLPNLSAPVPVPDRRINLLNHGWKKFDAQWGFKLYMTFAGSYRVGISGGVAFTPLASYGNKDKKIRVHRNTVAISLGYVF